jgi:hypothetical protein
MVSKLLSEDGWKAVAQKFKIKDTSLQKQLVLLEMFDENEYADRLKGLASVSQFANVVKKSKEAAANPEVIKYLASLLGAVESEQREVAKAKAAAEKTQAETKKKADAQAKEQGQGGAEEAVGDHAANLLATFQKLKSSKGLAYEFVVCDGKPMGLMVAKKITAMHKAQILKLTGSTRIFPVGSCSFAEGKFNFAMEKPIAGLARKLQESIKSSTGKKFPIVAGTESAEGEDDQPAGGAAPPAPATAASTAPPPPSGPLSISASVGHHGKNNPADVQAVQTALNNRAKAGLTVDGKCGSKTVIAIINFQKTIGMQRPDGLVEPGKQTEHALKTGQAGASSGGSPAKEAAGAAAGAHPESAASGGAQPSRAASAPAPPTHKPRPELAKAPHAWHGTRDTLDKAIDSLKKAVLHAASDEPPALIKEIDKKMSKLDGIMHKLDTRLADSLAKASAAKDDAARTAELKNSKTILAGYIGYVKSEPLIAHIDSNPFGIQTNLKKVLITSLTQMSQSIG